ncbi:MAG: hypothetical protein KIT58_10555 [Planctomycetota bacterium]|nr:hypothetical protein [Planctomycetota bacterium]
MLLIGGGWAKDWIGAPRIEVRNDTGRVLTSVRARGFQLDAGERTAEVASLAPGESITLSGGHTDYELSLHSLTFDDGRDVVGAANDPHAWSRFDAVPWRKSLIAIDSQERLRTIIDGGTWGGSPLSCTCPDGNATRTGSPSCPIDIHRIYDPERARKSASTSR